MKLSVAEVLGLAFLSAFPLISALELPPNHAPPKMLVIPPNVTIMTPQIRNSAFEQQTFDFGSAQSGFSELRRVLERQSACSSGTGSCPNDPGTCCQIGGRCCGGGKCCNSGHWCYGGGCCLNTQNGCDNQGCCEKGQACCSGGGCCEAGKNCVRVNGKIGCCPIGQTCTGPPTCQDAGYLPCTGETFCCPTGYQCYRDSTNAAKCRDPNPPPPTTSYTPPEPSTTYVPPTSTTEEETSTYQPPPPDPTTVVVSTTRTVIQTYPTTQTVQASASSASRATSSGANTTSRAVETGAVIGAQTTKANTGAIVGGVVAGVVAIVLLVIIIIVLRRRSKSETPSTGAQPAYPPVPPKPSQYNEAGMAPPTPGSGNPFLTPMAQNQNLGASYFGGVAAPGSPVTTTPSGSNSGTGPYNAPHYSGLPEPQQNAIGGFGTAMPTPRYDSSHPHPLPMTIVHSQQPQNSSGGSVSRPWSGYVPPPTANSAPYAESNNSQPSAWAVPTNNSTSPPPQMGYANPPYADQSGSRPGRPASTVYQPSSHVAYSPPGSPPLPEVYGGMAPSGSGGVGGLPPGAAPPANMYGSNEKKSYVPYQ